VTLRGLEVEYSADGTRYRLVVVVDPAGGLLVVWPDAQWSAWASPSMGGEVRAFPQPKQRALSGLDAANIGRAVDHARRALDGSPDATPLTTRLAFDRQVTVLAYDRPVTS
jgi:hypothetical protein